MPSDNPACADCKAKKKRCIHRYQPVKVAKVEAVSASMSPPSAAAPVLTPASTPVPVAAPVLTPASTPVPVAVAGSSTRGRRKTADATTKEMSPAPADSSDELSSVPSEAEEKPMANKYTTHSRRAKPSAASENVALALGLSGDSLQAAATMSVHRVWARELRDNLQELERCMEAFDEAHRATMASAQAIQHTVDGWIQTWAASGR
ncbi:uncharacterized protein N7518_000529 [Penicillium psychrosexuale]|uniref:uncharacterized protein n=1 Tax=Penicillium psychrosexuale TaxID=1002107 RepID=UPI002544D381|nr:uncharacterized protein N7518_000529 [Penicillium psychrosexuale]KAJ5804226.1 hypothetical protein N7518_000529 [Penicillium psychrosexuale]